ALRGRKPQRALLSRSTVAVRYVGARGHNTGDKPIRQKRLVVVWTTGSPMSSLLCYRNHENRALVTAVQEHQIGARRRSELSAQSAQQVRAGAHLGQPDTVDSVPVAHRGAAACRPSWL